MAFTFIDKLVVLYLVLVNIVAFVMYGMDKSKAKKGQWRIPEKSLLFVAFIGGALGAFLGMRIFRHKTKHLQFRILVPFFLIAHIVLLVVLYTGAYYHADELALSMANADTTDGSVTVTNNSDSIFFDGPGSRDLMVFYQGAKVEPEAYAPLLENIASKGTDCCLLKAPLRLAVLNTKQAGSIDTQGYEHVYLAGHSMGGVVACMYASQHLDDFSGVILFASYPTKSLQKDGFRVLSMVGTEDGGYDEAKWKDAEQYMPRDYSFQIIEGGNHGYFGNYGEQAGDGTATITRQQQQEEAAQLVTAFVNAA